MIWLVITAIVLLAATWVGLPFLRGRVIETNAGDVAISIYADQIDEVERDRAQGLISSKDAQAAVAEIEHRRTRVARDMPGGFAVSQPRCGVTRRLRALWPAGGSRHAAPGPQTGGAGTARCCR